VSVFFCESPVGCFEDVLACDLEAHAAWCRELLSRGVYPPPSQFEAWFPSLAHSDEDVEATIAAAAAAFEAIR
jgi:glutamate-1-semialdehyde 2,1-aminomutase